MTGFGRRSVASDRFSRRVRRQVTGYPQERAGTGACPQMCWRLGRLRSASGCLRRDGTRHTTISRPGMAAWPGMGTHHPRGVCRGAEPYAVRGTSGVAAGPAQNRRFLAPDRRSAPGLVAAGDHRPPGLRRHAQRRSSSPAAWAAGLPPHPAVPDEPGQRAADHHGGRDNPRCCARPGCARSGYPR